MDPVFCTVIIPTIGRDSLTRAVTSVLEQNFNQEPIEIVVVNDSGHPLSPQAWQVDARVEIIHTQRRERCVARNTGAAIARGRYLFFLDDDDWILPGALQALWVLSLEQPGAIWLYGGVRVIGRLGANLGEVNAGLSGNALAQVIGGAWVPLQSSIISSNAFFAAGGFDPAIFVTQDQDLCRRLALIGDLAYTPAVVGCLFRGNDWETSTNYHWGPHFTRVSREKVVQEEGSLKRMLASADSAYWHGRVFHVYAGLALWHLRNRVFCRFLSCTFMAILIFLTAGIHVATGEFWQGLRDEHVPDSLHFIMFSAEQESTPNKIYFD